MTTQSLELVVSENRLPVTEADAIRSAFAPLFEQATQWASRVDTLSVTDVSQVREMKLARESRLALKEIRCNAERKRKELKEDALRKGNAIDGLYNVIAYLVEPLEKRLLDMEQFAERKEEARLDERLKERTAALAYYEYTAIDGPTLRALTDEAYDAILESAKVRHESMVAERARIEQEKLAKEKAEAQERERVRLENERLKAEAAAKDAEMCAQREAQEKALAEQQAEFARQRREQEAKQKKLREAQEAKLRQERDKAVAEQQARKQAELALEQERTAAKIAAQKQKRREEVARVEAAAKAKAEKDAAEEARKRAEFAPDRDKLQYFADAIAEWTLPELKSEIGKRAQRDLTAMKQQFEAAVNHYLSKL